MQVIDLWVARFDELAQRFDELDALLNADEQQRAQRFLGDDVRLKFIMSRGMLREILGHQLGERPSKIDFSYGRRGKPSIKGSVVQFNLSHAHNMVLLGIVEKQIIGVDIEFIREMKEMPTVTRDNFSQQEQSVWFALPDEQKHRAFYTCWTRKEAYIKATGDGFSLPLRDFDVTFTPDETPRLLRAEGDDPQRWTLLHVDPAPDYIGAICVEGQGEFEIRQQVFK